MFLFPLWPFWQWTPWQYLAVLIWNCSELLHVPAPFAPYLFGVIMGRMPHRAPHPQQQEEE